MSKLKLFIILDKSGSMSSVDTATISGLNEYLQTLRQDKSDYQVSLTLFDTVVRTLFEGKNIKDVTPLTRDDYTPSGMTALLDAVGSVVTEAKSSVKKTEKALVCIMTDGYENSSREWNQKSLSKLINELEKSGNWTFTFLGANQDSWDTAQAMGFKNQGNVANYRATNLGMAAGFDSMAVNTSNLAGGAQMRSASFYAADKDKLDDESLNG